MHFKFAIRNFCALNRLTTTDKCTLATCYQLAQSVLKIVFALTWGEVDGSHKTLVGTGWAISLSFNKQA